MIPRPRKPRARAWLIAERVLWAGGIACLLAWSALSIAGARGMRYELDRFVTLRAAAQAPGETPDQSLWSPERISAWRNALKQPSPAPLGVLRIPRLHVEVPILEGTDDGVLDRGVGHIGDTAQPGSDGNIGIAGHRDGYFRALKDIAPGDVIEIQTLQATEVYRVERTWIVAPEEVSVLDRTPVRSVTLVTCYPFYFVGSAPQRFIVRAVQHR